MILENLAPNHRGICQRKQTNSRSHLKASLSEAAQKLMHLRRLLSENTFLVLYLKRPTGKQF